MRRMTRAVLGGGMLLLLLLCAGCGRESIEEPGVAATVNGVPIRVAALEARHDLEHLALPEVGNPAVEHLRHEYGAILADMIVTQLAAQELDRRHLSVTDAEVAAAEATVRADYTKAAFEQLLLEQRIDLDRWREALRDHLIVEKLARKILAPTIRVGVTEAADYYKEHIDLFRRPHRTHVLLVRAKDPAVLTSALAAYRKRPDRAALQGQHGVSIQDVTISDAQLPKSWRKALKGLKNGEASDLVLDDAGSAVLVLLENLPATVLEPAKAYARVEALLKADKLEQAMSAWLTATLAKSHIRVNPLILGHKTTDTRPVAVPSKTLPAPAVRPEIVLDQPSKPAVSPADNNTPTAATPSAPATPVTPLEPVGTDKPAPSSPTPPAQGTTASEQGASADISAPASATTQTSAQASSSGQPATPAPRTVAGQALGVVPKAAQSAADAPAGQKPTSETTAPSLPAASKPVTATPVSAKQAPGSVAASAPDTPVALPDAVELTAIKGSWVLYSVDAQKEQRVYLKPGKPVRIPFSQHLSVRLGSPSEVSYRFGDRKETVSVGKKTSRVLEFP